MQLAASINMFAHRLCFLPLVFFFRLGRFQEIFVVLVVTFCLAITPHLPQRTARFRQTDKPHRRRLLYSAQLWLWWF